MGYGWSRRGSGPEWQPVAGPDPGADVGVQPVATEVVVHERRG